MDTTNYYFVTNQVFVIATNAVPVTVVHDPADWDRYVLLWSWGFHYGAIMAGSLFAVIVVLKALRAPMWPRGE